MSAGSPVRPCGLIVAVDRKLVAVENMRGRTKADLPENDAVPSIEVNPDTFAVHIDGQEVEHEPAGELPMTQSYFLF